MAHARELDDLIRDKTDTRDATLIADLAAASAQRIQAADVMAAVAATEHHLSTRIDRLEATVNAHDDLIQQLRGARSLLTLIFGASVLTAVLGLLTLIGHFG